MTKRILSILLCMALFISVCAAPALAEETVTLEFWTVSLQPTFTEFINSVIAAYEADHPNVKINWVDLPWDGYQEKMVASMVDKNPADVVNLWDTLSLKESTSAVLTNLLEEATSEQLSIYQEGILEANYVHGGLYGFPWYVSVPVTIYNTELFKQAGFDAPPKNIAEMFEMAPEFHEKTGAYLYLPSGLYSEIHGETQVISDDETAATLNTPELLTYVTKMQQGAAEGWMPRDGWGDWNEAIKMYAQGKLGMISTNTQSVVRIQEEAPDKYEVSEVTWPVLYGRGFAYTSAYYLLIPKDSKHHEEAIDFANFVTNDENQLGFSKVAAIFPSTKVAAADPYFSQDMETLVGRARAVGSEVASANVLLCIDAVNVRYDEINAAMGDILEECIFDSSIDPQSAIDEAEAAINDILAEEQANK